MDGPGDGNTTKYSMKSPFLPLPAGSGNPLFTQPHARPLCSIAAPLLGQITAYSRHLPTKQNTVLQCFVPQSWYRGSPSTIVPCPLFPTPWTGHLIPTPTLRTAMAYLNSDCCCLHISSPSRGQKCLLQPTPIHPRSIGLQDRYIPLHPVHHMCGNCSFRLACDSLLGHYFELSCVYGGAPLLPSPPDWSVEACFPCCGRLHADWRGVGLCNHAALGYLPQNVRGANTGWWPADLEWQMSIQGSRGLGACGEAHVILD
jgi:hypothetical protein